MSSRTDTEQEVARKADAFRLAKYGRETLSRPAPMRHRDRLPPHIERVSRARYKIRQTRRTGIRTATIRTQIEVHAVTHSLRERISEKAANARDAASNAGGSVRNTVQKQGGRALNSIQQHGGHAVDAIQSHGGNALDSAWEGTKGAARHVGTAVGGLASQARDGAADLHTSFEESRKEAKSAQSAFAYLAPAIDLILPSEGGTCTVDVEFTIPVGKGVGFVGMHVTGTIARGTYVAGSGAALSGSGVQVGLYVAVTGGAQLHIAKAKFEAGAYISTQGPSAAGALDIASWTLYRNLLAESNLIPREVVEAMYGNKKLSADDWDDQTQGRYFKPGGAGYDPTNSGAVGLSLGASADIGTGPVSGSVGAKVKAGRVYDAKSIERRDGALSTTQKLMSKAADSGVRGVSDIGGALSNSDRGAQASLGDRSLTFIGSASVKATGIGGASVMVTAVLRQIKDKRPQQESSEWVLASLMVDAVAKSPALDALASLTSGAASIVSIVKGLVSASKDAADKVKNSVANEKDTKAGKAIASISNFSEGLATAFNAVSGLSIPTTLPGITSAGSIHLAGGMQAKQMNLYIGFEKLTSYSVDANVFSASYEKAERVGSIEYDGKSWVVHFGELEKEVAKTQKRKPLPPVPVKSGNGTAPVGLANGTALAGHGAAHHDGGS